jgi:hypothetical protein
MAVPTGKEGIGGFHLTDVPQISAPDNPQDRLRAFTG